MSNELEPLQVTQVHAARRANGLWDVTLRSQRSRITLLNRSDMFAAMVKAQEMILRGENDEQWEHNDGPKEVS